MRAAFHPQAAISETRRAFGEYGGINMSIEASTTFTVMAASTMTEIFHGQRGPEHGGCFLYGRHFNPTVFELGRQLAAMEATESAYCSASGMSAIAAALMQLCSSGDHIVASNTVYGGTYALLDRFLPAKAGIRTSFVRCQDLDEVAAAITPQTKVLYAETLANPTLVVADIALLADLAHARGVALVIDNTFCPMMVTPARFGADVVVHSLTKYINGASDVIGGAICARHDFIGRLMDLNDGALMLLGPTLDPKVAFEISMRLPHLGLRMIEHGRRALEFCRRLRARGITCIYPGLPDHPQHALLERMLNPGLGHGGVFAIDVGSVARAQTLMEELQRVGFGYMAVSLGHADTLMSCSSISTSSELGPEAQRDAGLLPGLIRISLGYTGLLEDRWAQLESGLRHIDLL